MKLSWSPTLFALFTTLLPTATATTTTTAGITRDDPDIKSVPLRTHSISQPYLDSDLQSRWFDFGGDTVIRTDQYIRLTPDHQNRAGWLFSRLPLTATNWEIEFEIRIHGSGTSLYGDGMALWITKQRAMPGPVFGSVDKFEGLGIFFDTYKNGRPGTVFPYVMAMLGDGETSYNSDNDGKDQQLAGCSARGIRDSPVPTKGRLTYFQENYLQLELQYKTENEWTVCFNTPNVTLPTVAYLGFSAHCGELTDNHEIISISAKNLYSTTQARNQANKQQPMGQDKGHSSPKDRNSSRKDGGGGGWGWFFIKFILFIVIVVGGYMGWVAYRTQRRHNRF